MTHYDPVRLREYVESDDFMDLLREIPDEAARGHVRNSVLSVFDELHAEGAEANGACSLYDLNLGLAGLLELDTDINAGRGAWYGMLKGELAQSYDAVQQALDDVKESAQLSFSVRELGGADIA